MADNNTYSGTQEDAATAASLNNVDPSYLAKVLRFISTPNVAPPDQSGHGSYGDPGMGSAGPPPPMTQVGPSVSLPMPPTAGTTARAPQPNTAPVSSMAGADQMLSQTNPGLPPAMSPSPPVDPRGAMPAPQPAIGRGPRTPMRPADVTNMQIGAAIDKFGGEAGNFLEGILGGGMPVAARAATSPTPAINQRPLISPPPPAAAAPSPGPQAAPPSAAAGAPPRAAAAQAGPAFPMGGGPGVTVPHDQAAAVAGGAGHLGTQVANDPNTVNSIISDLRTKGYANNPENFWLALAQAGFATMASRSPFALQAIGEGASAGMDAYSKMRSARMGQLTTAADLTAKQQQLQQERAYQNRMATVSEKEADVREKLLPGQIARDTAYANMLIPARVANYESLDASRGAGGSGGINGLTKAQNAARQKTFQSFLAQARANPPATLPADPTGSMDLATKEVLWAEQQTAANPHLWGGTAAATSVSPDTLKQQANTAIAQWKARTDLPEDQRQAGIDAVNARLAQALGGGSSQ